MSGKQLIENMDNLSARILCLKLENGKMIRTPLTPNTKSAANVVPNEPMKIVDLNFDCLEYILRTLSLVDLISIGSTCVRLNDAVCRVFTILLRKHEVCIDCNQFPRFSVRSQSMLSYQQFAIGHNIEAFLRVFGSVTTKLIILGMSPFLKYEDAQRLENDEMVIRLLMKYCKDHLIEINFKNCGKQAMANAQPFGKVTKVTFDRCNLGTKLTNFSYLFPSMRKLDMIDCNVTTVRNSIEMEFPQLECFNVTVPFDLNFWTGSTFSVENIMTAIDCNPNLKCLSLCYWNASAYDAKLLKYASVKLKQLKSLVLWHLKYTDLCSHGDIDFASVRKLTLANYYHVPGRLERNLTAFSCENLHTFCMIGEFDMECNTFISRHRTIQKLSILPDGQHGWYPSDEDIQRIAHVLPHLKKITINGSHMTANGLYRIFLQCNSLLVIKVYRFAFTAAIRKLFRWKCSKIGWNVTYNIDNGDTGMCIERQIH